jgi:hypothetical protein
MNLHTIIEHETLHHKALACLLLIKESQSEKERVHLANRYAEFMLDLSKKGIEKVIAAATENASEQNNIHPLMQVAVNNGLTALVPKNLREAATT